MDEGAVQYRPDTDTTSNGINGVNGVNGNGNDGDDVSTSNDGDNGDTNSVVSAEKERGEDYGNGDDDHDNNDGDAGSDDTEFGDDEGVEFEVDPDAIDQEGNGGAITLKGGEAEAGGDDKPDVGAKSKTAMSGDDTLLASSPGWGTNATPGTSTVGSNTGGGTHPGEAYADRGLVKGLARFLVGDGDVGVVRRAPVIKLKDTYFGEGRLAMSLGMKGEVIPVHEDEFASIIAFSLASVDYNKVLQQYINAVGVPPGSAPAGGDGDGSDKTTKTTGPGTMRATEATGDDHASRFTEASLQSLGPDRGVHVTGMTMPILGEEGDGDGDRMEGTEGGQRYDSTDTTTTHEAKVNFQETVERAEREARDGAATLSRQTDEFNQKMLLSSRITHIKDRFDDKDRKGKTVCTHHPLYSSLSLLSHFLL